MILDGYIGEALKQTAWVNDRGNSVYNLGIYHPDLDRYHFDFEECTEARGFKQYDTEQDASYFGIWVDVGRRLTVTYAEGDLAVVVCPSEDGLRAELASMAAFYGKAPPFAIGISEDGSVTHYYDERPKV